MGQSRAFSSSSFRSNQSTKSLGHFRDEDFDQEALSSRYGNSRDRQVVGKMREARSRPRQWECPHASSTR